jgi:transaldolase / glucose-6-phosphate isomerase
VNPLQRLRDEGQSVWLDFLARRFTAEGRLRQHIAEEGLAGVTSNPTIFKKAIAGSTDYDAALKAIADEDRSVTGLYEALAVEDIRAAADVLRPIYDATDGADGFVSLECSPYLADDTGATIGEARRLWAEVARPNVMIKVPGTKAGLPAIQQLLGEGININITLLFARAVYCKVVEAYLAGAEEFIAGGGNAKRLGSVASFFVSRIDTAVDKRIEARLKEVPAGEDRDALAALRGRIAIANAKLAYRDFKQLFAGARWEALRRRGARVQRLLWASTSTKNPAYRDVLYVEELIGPDTVNTMPPETMEAFRDHGTVRPRLEESVAEAERDLATLERSGISLDAVTAALTEEGVRLFSDSFDELLGALARKRIGFLGPEIDAQARKLPAGAEEDTNAALEAWRTSGNVRRLWAKDALLWTGADEAQWLGWLTIAAEERADAARLAALAAEAQRENFSHVLLLGMGGSSLGAEVFARTFNHARGAPELRVLDSTDPAQIRAAESAVNIARTLFVVSSKSGTTLEPNILRDYFFDRAQAVLGTGKAGAHFIAITDPGSKLAEAAAQQDFRAVCYGRPEIGGRYSVLSDFGLVPAALKGVDVERLLGKTESFVRASGADVPPMENAAVRLGIVLGTLAKRGCDKLTILASPGIADFGAWLEQLVAESTGKAGKGIIPVDGEPLGAPEAYGKDRVFAYLSLKGETDAAQEDLVAKLERRGLPVIRVGVCSRYHIGQEFLRWEIATAVAGAVIGINPFDQPDVEASKIETRKLMEAYERDGALPAEAPLFVENGIALFADAENARALQQGSAKTSLAGWLGAHLGRLQAGDYCALLAYIERSPRHERALRDIRATIRDAKRVATCAGFGPRFLHSTGQAYKGGPNSGVFLQITADPANELPVPGRRYGFGAVIAAQARGDLAVLNKRERRALRVHMGKDVERGLAAIAAAVNKALG